MIKSQLRSMYYDDYDSFNQVVYSSSVIFPLSHSAFFSLARSPQVYSSSGRIFPDFVQANRFLYSRRYALKTSSVSFSRVHFAMAPTSLQVRPFESNTRSQYSALVRPVIAKYFPQFLQTRIFAHAVSNTVSSAAARTSRTTPVLRCLAGGGEASLFRKKKCVSMFMSFHSGSAHL